MSGAGTDGNARSGTKKKSAKSNERIAHFEWNVPCASIRVCVWERERTKCGSQILNFEFGSELETREEPNWKIRKQAVETRQKRKYWTKYEKLWMNGSRQSESRRTRIAREGGGWPLGRNLLFQLFIFFFFLLSGQVRQGDLYHFRTPQNVCAILGLPEILMTRPSRPAGGVLLAVKLWTPSRRSKIPSRRSKRSR